MSHPHPIRLFMLYGGYRMTYTFDNYATALLNAARMGKAFHTVRLAHNKILVVTK